MKKKKVIDDKSYLIRCARLMQFMKGTEELCREQRKELQKNIVYEFTLCDNKVFNPEDSDATLSESDSEDESSAEEEKKVCNAPIDSPKQYSHDYDWLEECKIDQIFEN